MLAVELLMRCTTYILKLAGYWMLLTLLGIGLLLTLLDNGLLLSCVATLGYCARLLGCRC